MMESDRIIAPEQQEADQIDRALRPKYLRDYYKT